MPAAASLTAGVSAAVCHWWLQWRERRFAGRHCRVLLRLHRRVARRHPGLRGPELYRHIVAARSGADPAAAQAVLQGAEESFARWPVSRELSFRDVVHYLSVTEYFARHAGVRLMQADVKRVVDDSIPAHL